MTIIDEMNSCRQMRLVRSWRPRGVSPKEPFRAKAGAKLVMKRAG